MRQTRLTGSPPGGVGSPMHPIAPNQGQNRPENPTFQLGPEAKIQPPIVYTEGHASDKFRPENPTFQISPEVKIKFQ